MKMYSPKLKGYKSSLIIMKTTQKNFRHNGNLKKERINRERKIQRNCIDYARIFALYIHEILSIMQKLEMENYIYYLYSFISSALIFTPLLTTNKSNQKMHVKSFTG